MTQTVTAKKPRKKKKGTQPRDYITPKEIARVVNFEEDEPFDVLGPHALEGTDGSVIRAFLPHAHRAWIRLPGKAKTTMKKIDDRGLFEVWFNKPLGDGLRYKVGYENKLGTLIEREDPYAFLPAITDMDLCLLSEGNLFKSYEKLGSRAMTLNGTKGAHFAVWAPNARSVSIVGNFNHWQPGAHPMTRVHFSGLWSLFVPGLDNGEVYKYSIRSRHDNRLRMKSDPYAFGSELRPKTASIVTSLEKHKWRDNKWIKKRRESNYLAAPISIYEVHLGSWKLAGKHDWERMNYRDLAHELVNHVKAHGYTHIELMPIMEHPLDESWGYQVVSFYAPTSRFGTPQDFMYFVDYCHRHDVGVILDWVPAHFPRDEHGLADFDGAPLYNYADWKKGEQRDWGTLVFDYEKNEVRNFLISNALFWLDKYHIDGLRVDAVASMLYLDYSRKDGEWQPNIYGGRENLEAMDLIKKLNEIVHANHPGVLTIAEESTDWPGVSKPTYLSGLGFSLKWNMGWMHDILDYFEKDPIYRKYHQGMLTFALLYAFSEKFVLPISHDEVVYGKRSLLEKMPGDDWQKFANCRLFFAFMFGHPGKKLNFMTNDIGQRAEWNCKKSLDWHLTHHEPHRQLELFFKDLQNLYTQLPALHEMDCDPNGFEWIDFKDSDASVISFIRWSRDKKQALIFVFNMTPVTRQSYRIGVPREGRYQEVLNSDAAEYGGSGIGNYGGYFAERIAWHGHPASLPVNTPPLGCIVFLWNENAPSAFRPKRKVTRKQVGGKR